MARSSEALGIFLRVAADERLSWHAVELAGKGISADAASTLWVLSDGKSSRGGEELSELLIEQGELVDVLTEAWQSFDSGDLSVADFEVQLQVVVTGFEEWLFRVSRRSRSNR
jgi:hypothetical protein